MNQQPRPPLAQVVRLGLPVAVLIYYASAVLGFEYTPDSSFFTVYAARELATGAGLKVPSVWPNAGYPTPLWTLLVAAGHFFRLDYVLTAKILSLLFGSSVIVLSYLVAVEILRDNLQAFLSAIVIGLQSWLVQAAPSGNGLPLALSLALAAVYFILRNEYLLATIFAGLGALVTWELAGMIFLIWLDITVNTKEKARARTIKLGCVLAFAGVILPWVLGSIYAGAVLLPELVPVAHAADVTLFEEVEYFLLAAFTLGGLVIVALSGATGRAILRGHYPLWLWMLLMTYVGWGETKGIFLLALPLFVIYAFFGLQHIVARYFPEDWRYTLSIVVAGGLLLTSQLTFTLNVKPGMAAWVEESHDLEAIARWLHSSAPEAATVSAEQGGLLEYYSGRRILSSFAPLAGSADFIVSVDPPTEGYQVAFDPQEANNTVMPDHGRRFVVWTKDNNNE